MRQLRYQNVNGESTAVLTQQDTHISMCFNPLMSTNWYVQHRCASWNM